MHEKLAGDLKCQARHDTFPVCVQYKNCTRSSTNTNEQVYSVGVSLRLTILRPRRRVIMEKPSQPSKEPDPGIQGWTGMYTLVVPPLSAKLIKNSHQNLPI